MATALHRRRRRLLLAVLATAVVACAAWLVRDAWPGGGRDPHRTFGHPSGSPDGTLCVIWEMDYRSGPGSYRLWLVGSDAARVLPTQNGRTWISRAIWLPSGREIAWLEMNFHSPPTAYLAVYDVRADKVARARIDLEPPITDLASTFWELIASPSDGRGLIAYVEVQCGTAVPARTGWLYEIDVRSGDARMAAKLGTPPPLVGTGYWASRHGAGLVYIDGRTLYEWLPNHRSRADLAITSGILQTATDGAQSAVALQKAKSGTRLLEMQFGTPEVKELLRGRSLSRPQLIAGTVFVMDGAGSSKVECDRLLAASGGGEFAEIYEGPPRTSYSVVSHADDTIVWLCHQDGEVVRLRLDGLRVVNRKGFVLSRLRSGESR